MFQMVLLPEQVFQKLPHLSKRVKSRNVTVYNTSNSKKRKLKRRKTTPDRAEKISRTSSTSTAGGEKTSHTGNRSRDVKHSVCIVMTSSSERQIGSVTWRGGWKQRVRRESSGRGGVAREGVGVKCGEWRRGGVKWGEWSGGGAWLLVISENF